MSAESGLDIKSGNAMKLKNIPIGTLVHNIELNIGQGGTLLEVRNICSNYGRDGKYVSLRLPSGEMRYVLGECMATTWNSWK